MSEKRIWYSTKENATSYMEEFVSANPLHCAQMLKLKIGQVSLYAYRQISICGPTIIRAPRIDCTVSVRLAKRKTKAKKGKS